MKNFNLKGFFIFLLLLLYVKQIDAQLKINELFITNGSKDINTATYNYDNWIEVYNTSATNQNSASFYISDDSTKLKKCRLSSYSVTKGGYKAFFLENLNLKPDADGGILYLTNSSGKVIDRFVYPKQFYNVSYGRYPNGSITCSFLLSPTRDKANLSPADSKSGIVSISHAGGFYTSAITLTLLNATGVGKIYYTIDGTEPDTSSLIYTKPISLTKTAVIRTRIIEANKIPGNIITQTYFINQRKPQMNVVSLVCNPKNLFDNTLGIYVVGTNGILGNCSDGKVNWNRDWERSTNFELFNKSQNLLVNQMVGIKISGACSRNNPQKSLAVYAKEKYGKGKVNYKLFNDRAAEEYNSFILRNSGNDYLNTQCRDAILQKLLDRFMNIEHQASEPAAIFINGQYYGIQFLYERSGADLIETSFGLTSDKIDMGEFDGVQVEGSTTDYQNLLTYISNNSLAVKANYDKVVAQMDIDNYIDYLIFQIYIGNNDWPGNNTKFWRRNNPKTKWRWIVYDTDFGFGFYTDANMFSLLLDPIGTSWPNPEWSTRLFRKLIENPEFKQKFVNRFYAHINSTFKPDLVIKTIDSVTNLIKNEVPYHFTRWGSSSSSWTYNIQKLRDYAQSRPEIIRDQLRSFLGTGQNITVECHTQKPGYGYLCIDNAMTADTAYSGVFPSGAILNLNFIPAPGYKFKKAVKTSNNAKTEFLISKNDQWNFYDSILPSSSNWEKIDFDDSAWKIGNAQFGYGDGDENTVISYGSDANNKFVTSYFRKVFNCDSSTYKDLTLKLLADDGAIVYLNDKEIVRQNIQEGPFTDQTLAANSDPENVYSTYLLNDTLLLKGNNVIAVEVHQAAVTSSDVSFDLELSVFCEATAVTEKIIYQNNMTDTLYQNTSYTLFFERASAISNLVINEIGPLNNIYPDEYGEMNDWIELYNNGSDTVELSGLYLSDSSAFPYKYRIPTWNGSPVKIAPKTYKVIWTDNQIKQGPLHANFKLNSNKEEFGIFQKVGEDVVTIDYTNWLFNGRYQSYGRIPNITGPFRLLLTSSPLAKNNDNPTVLPETFRANSDMPNIWYQENTKSIIIDPANRTYFGVSKIRLIDISGKAILMRSITSEKEQIDVGSLKKGVYFVEFSNSKFHFSSKLMIY